MKNNNLKGLTCFKFEREVARSPVSGICNCLILESDPKPDYYSRYDFPPHDRQFNDRHLYLLIKNTMICFHELIVRHSAALQKKYENHMHVYPGWMTFHNEDFLCIRLDTDHSDQIPALINDLRKYGLVFVPDRKADKYSGYIFYKKFIEFLQVADRVFQDKDHPNRYFFPIPKQADVSDLKHKTEIIKNNCNIYLFDSFLADLFIDNAFMDFYGIYVHQSDKDLTATLRKEIDKHYAPEKKTLVK